MTARHPIIQIPYKRWPQTAWRNIHRGVFRRGIDPDVQNLLNDMLSTLTDQAAEMEENNYLEIERSLERALYGITGLPVITVDATAGNPHNAQYTSLATAVASVSGGAIIIVRSTGGIFETLTVAASVENIVIMQSQPDAGAAANNVQFDHITGGAAGCVVTFLGCNVSFSNATSLDNGYTGQLSFVNCPVVSSTNTSGSIIGSVSTDLVAVDTSFLAGNPLLGAYNTAFVSNCIVQQLFTDAATISAATFSNCSIQGIAPFATTTITMTMANSSAKVRFVGCDFTTPTSTHTWSITYNSSTSSTQSIEFIGCNVNCKGATTISYTAMNDGSAWLMSGCTFQTRANTCAITHATTGKSSIVYSGVIGPQLSITQSGHTDTLFTASGVFRKITVATGGAIIDAQLDLNAASVTGIVVTGDGAVINASFVNFGAAAVGLNISGSNGIALLTCAGGTIATLFTNSGSGNNINSFPPNGAAGGDLTGTYPNPTLAGIITAGGPTGSTSVIPVITWDAKGRLTVVSTATPTHSTIGTATGDVSWGSNKITSVKDPTSAQDAMTKNYADAHYVLQASIDDIVMFTSSGSFAKATYPGIRAIRVRCVGGGGGGGGVPVTGAGAAAEAGGGGGGSYAEVVIPVSSLATSETVTVGAAGTAGTSAPGTGGSGGDTSFGTWAVAGGGGGGAQGAASAGNVSASRGTGGTASAGDIQTAGSGGQPGVVYQGRQFFRGDGGASGAGMGGFSHNGTSNHDSGSAGAQYGGGGQGAVNGPSQSAIAGSAGAAGVVIVDLIY